MFPILSQEKSPPRRLRTWKEEEEVLAPLGGDVISLPYGQT